MKRRIPIATLSALALLGALTSCGSDEAGTTTSETSTTIAEATTEPSAPATTRAVAAVPDTTRATTAATSPPPAPATAYFANCTDAKAAGAAPLRRSDPGYRSALDRDGDGIACET